MKDNYFLLLSSSLLFSSLLSFLFKLQNIASAALIELSKEYAGVAWEIVQLQNTY